MNADILWWVFHSNDLKKKGFIIFWFMFMRKKMNIGFKIV